MKEIKLSFPYPSTSRHNLSQDIALSMSMGLVIPVRVVKVLGGDSHRIGTSYSLVSNPLVKPLLQGVKMRYCRFWVPSRIYSIDQRANNSNFDILNAPVRTGVLGNLRFPVLSSSLSASNFQQSSLFDYLQIANVESNFVDISGAAPTSIGSVLNENVSIHRFNAEPYLAYIDICRNYFSDSATGMIGWSTAVTQNTTSNVLLRRYVCVSPLSQLDAYIDSVQNSRGNVFPYNWTSTSYDSTVTNSFTPFCLTPGSVSDVEPSANFGSSGSKFAREVFGASHVGFCVPLNRPDRFSRFYDTRPLTSQNATVAPSEISIGNLSMLSKLQRYLTRTFFGGSRFTDVMYSVLGQKVPHVDSPILLDVFDQELGSELVASTNASAESNPGVLGGFFSSSGHLQTGRGSYKRRYTFNEPGYLVDCCYIQPRLFRSAFYPDFYLTSSDVADGSLDAPMSQGNFTPDFNGIGWQQPAFVQAFQQFAVISGDSAVSSRGPLSFCCEPSWQQYRTLPDVCMGAFASNRSSISASVSLAPSVSALNINSPIYVFTDRMSGENYFRGFKASSAADLSNVRRYLLAQFAFTDFNVYNRIFGTDTLVYDNFFVVFRYAHQSKRQVSKRFTLTFA